MITSHLKNANGQMAIFIALIFQVLFVVFAMAINIGLVIHDKINLQNAVDFAAYYAAQRQAEQLNVIAHQNYQIRQAYKLMVWRYRVLGSSGLGDHPSRSPQLAPEVPLPVVADRPTMCVSRKSLFRDIGEEDDICKTARLEIPEIRPFPSITNFDPINLAFFLMVRETRRNIQQLCRDYGSFNYAFAAKTLGAFRLEQAARKELIRGIARNMARPFEDMVDLDGAPVGLGAQKTFENNLTYENFSSRGGIEFFNSLQGLDPSAWLHEIPIKLEMYYTDMKSGGGCVAQERQLAPSGPNYRGNFSEPEMAALQALVQPAVPGSPYQFSLGFEKNPWVMVYAGVKARSAPRQIFWPFGDRIQFEAKAFAQPFGGRVGPWYYNRWPRREFGAGSGPGQKVDLVVAPLAEQMGAANPDDNDYVLPNYGRYPGDPLGLKSAAAHSAYRGLQGVRAWFDDYKDVTAFGPNAFNDPLAYASDNSELRAYEMAAVAPDLFDITYYSIDPNFMGSGKNPTASSNGARLRASKGAMGIPPEVPLLGDHGSRTEVGREVTVSVKDLIGSQIFHPDAGWFVRDRAHLLVDWVHNDSFEVADGAPINLDRFGRCVEYDDDKNVRAPSSCIAGGRTGYSVKIVSREFLYSPMRLGGGEDTINTILNPPPEGF